ncbi:bifunctional tryptophan synthase trp1 [Lobulomyces angularis]|nr:bifunctional tryptophan synthase trp1 [Lobulomyces angularis]
MSTILIDNYDSFTWNVYQYLSDLGAKVEVFRNDKITLEELIKLNPRNLVISPGPGRPIDAGVSMKAIEHFGGKIPILGVCLGEQCMYEVYGGTVTYAGEIVHGKTSGVQHDEKGLYENIPQDIQVTRYHSLAGDYGTLPNELEVTSWCDRQEGETGYGKGVVMGVRHKKFVMEGVQYHPEGIASEFGRKMFANFLTWEGGLWKDLKINKSHVKWERVGQGSGADNGNSDEEDILKSFGQGLNLKKVSKMNSIDRAPKELSILEKIYKQRLIDVKNLKSEPGFSFEALKKSYALNLAPKQIDFLKRLNVEKSNVAICAEIKRASPSKGDIDLGAHAPSNALTYAYGGAAVISVLTEPTWFKGSIDDMRSVRLALENVPNRPAVLRKDFIIDAYQILEARLNGADTILLIVAILSEPQLKQLMSYSRMLGMEPLVEVATKEEMKIALACKAKVIGVNNRDLHTFNVDMNRTSNLGSLISAEDDVTLIALSGISQRSDVEKYIAAGAKAVLVGESLMKSSDKENFIKYLLGIESLNQENIQNKNACVKVCGITNASDAIEIAQLGVDFLGLIFAPSARNVSFEKAKDIIDAVKLKFSNEVEPKNLLYNFINESHKSENNFDLNVRKLSALKKKYTRPLFVGVFSNHTLQEINEAVINLGLDLVQLHGNLQEELQYSELIKCPVIKTFHVMSGDDNKEVLKHEIEYSFGKISFGLLDTGIHGKLQQGGSGISFDWNLAAEIQVPCILAGGLTSENVKEAIQLANPWCVDVCGGVEMNGVKGKKDINKIKDFINTVKST